MTTLLIILAACAFGLAIVGLYVRSARKEGELAERLEQHETSDKARKDVDKLANKVDAMSGDEARDKLTKRWSRD